jgi:hypothetical protein
VAFASFGLEIDIFDFGFVEGDFATLAADWLFCEGEIEQATRCTCL